MARAKAKVARRKPRPARAAGEAKREAKPELEWIPTGIPGLDKLLKGFERRSVVIVAGGPGTGKTIFGLQYLYDGATKYGENGLFITFEEQKEKVYGHSLEFGWDFAALERERKILFLEYSPHEVERFITEGGVIEDMIHEYNIKRVVIDSMTTFMLLYDTEYRRRQAFIKTMETLRKWGCTTLVTSEGRVDQRGQVHTKFGIEHLADGLITVCPVPKNGREVLAVEVVKMRGVAHERKRSPMEFTPKGIVIHPKGRVET